MDPKIGKLEVSTVQSLLKLKRDLHPQLDQQLYNVLNSIAKFSSWDLVHYIFNSYNSSSFANVR